MPIFSAIPASLIHLKESKTEMSLMRNEAQRLDGTLIEHRETIQQKVQKGQIKNIIKLDYDGTVTHNDYHCSCLAWNGLNITFNDQVVNFTNKEDLIGLLKLAVEDDTFIIVNSNNPFAMNIYHSLYRLLHDVSVENADEILKHIPIVTPTPLIIRGNIFTADEVLDIEQFVQKDLSQYDEDKVTSISKIAKEYLFFDYLNGLGLLDHKLELYTVDDSESEIACDMRYLNIYDLFNIELKTTIQDAKYIKSNSRMPQVILDLITSKASVVEDETDLDSEVEYQKTSIKHDNSEQETKTLVIESDDEFMEPENKPVSQEDNNSVLQDDEATLGLEELDTMKRGLSTMLNHLQDMRDFIASAYGFGTDDARNPMTVVVDRTFNAIECINSEENSRKIKCETLQNILEEISEVLKFEGQAIQNQPRLRNSSNLIIRCIQWLWDNISFLQHVMERPKSQFEKSHQTAVSEMSMFNINKQDVTQDKELLKDTAINSTQLRAK